MRRVLLFALAGSLTCGCASFPRANPAGIWVRVNQVGYLPEDPKIAILSSDVSLSGVFAVGDFSADIGPDRGAWGPFRHNYRLDFSALKKSGRHALRFRGREWATVLIGDDVYRSVPEKLLSFLRLQRCGENPVTGKKCHTEDAVDAATGEKFDMVGGWHDAGDRIKHSITTSYCVAALFLAGAGEEARYGAAYLKKLHPKPGALYIQVGDDRDHQGGWTLWHEDPVDYGFGRARPAWRSTGKPEGGKYKNASTGLANLAGRFAAALVLAGEVETAKSLYQLAKDNPGCAQSVPVRESPYYGEQTFADDLEWAAAELYRATKEPQYLAEAIRFADLAHDDSWMGRSRHGHYQYFPYVNLAHWRLYEFVDEDAKKRIAGYYRSGLEEVRLRAEQNPYRLGTPLVWCSSNDVVALATQALLYQKMTGDSTYRQLAAEACDWIFGRNPWGVSMVIGVPEGGTFASQPHHPFYAVLHQPPVGGLVDGPVEPSIHARLRDHLQFDDPHARFQSSVAIYHDTLACYVTNEPILDGTVSLLLLIKLWQN